MKRYFCSFLLFLIASLFLTGIVQAQEKVIKMDFSSFLPPTDRVSIAFEAWAKEVEKKSNGRIKINFYPGATLTPGAQTYDSVVRGIIDLGSSSLAYTRGRFPMIELLDLPLGLRSAKLATRLSNEYYKKYATKEFSDSKIMFFSSHGPGLLFSRKPVKSLEDLKGMKVKCAAGATVDMLSALGAAPVPMSMGDTYDALQRGMLDGMLGPYAVLSTYRLGEVVKYSPENYRTAYFNTFFVAMNKDKWNSLPKDLQKTIEDINEQWIDKAGDPWDEEDNNGKKFMKQKGAIAPLSSAENARWASQVKPQFDKFVKEKATKGHPAAEALKWCQEWIQKNQK
ncbi:MAG: Sialic acid-binding periplasmic protein SiaP precursor [Syntrophorhabdaceae bacterium PtaU1.Bin034]|nr:MAG: Sialic acid-binding periplasmic protein SiaP precursor [Syntrophorhabdaceae bacterium PtaU1.Bin034]